MYRTDFKVRRKKFRMKGNKSKIKKTKKLIPYIKD